MNKSKTSFVGIDLFAGAGGLSLGAEMAGMQVVLAIEQDKYAATTYKVNHPNTKVIIDSIQNIENLEIDVQREKHQVVLFGGPPCQGFSSSNQRTRNKDNASNWLFCEFLRMVDIVHPDWVVFENVHGFTNTENKLFLRKLITGFEIRKYTAVWYVLNAVDYGIPQNRERFFLVASKHGHRLNMPEPLIKEKIKVGQAISDLPQLCNGANVDYMEYRSETKCAYATLLRGGLIGCTGHLVTKSASYVIERYTYIPQGGNWKYIPEELMKNYADKSRCHQGIYHRLDPNKPSITIGNYRKAMLIHPYENRGLSVREAARIQSFPDSYVFIGSLGFQQQQVGNAVPPLLAKTIFSMIINGEYQYGE